MKKKITIQELLNISKTFCEEQKNINHLELIGVTDGKAVGTYIEHKFKDYIAKKYEISIGNSAKGIDFPDAHINTDIKVTSIKQPQSSCPFKNARQKIFGLGYNLLIFVYDKIDNGTSCNLDFKYLTFVEAKRTADFTTTKRVIEMVSDGSNKEDIIGFLMDKNIPADDITYNELAQEIIENTPNQGFLTISNALQWRLQYSRVITLNNEIQGVLNYEWK